MGEEGDLEGMSQTGVQYTYICGNITSPPV
jgi:hypothetical protein